MVGQGPASAGTRTGSEPRLGGLLVAGFLSALMFGAAGFVTPLAPLSLFSPLMHDEKPRTRGRTKANPAASWRRMQSLVFRDTDG